MKKFLYAVYILIVVSLAVATIVENSFGTEFAGRHIYGAWWFTSLWTALVVLGCAWIVHRKMRRWSLLLLHGSFVIILVGAAITHFTAKRGMIHLRTGEQTSSYIISDGNKGMDTAELPYTLRLDTFAVSYHEGTDAAADFVSFLTVSDGKGVQKARVSMNNIFSYKGIRLYQNSYDDDGGGTVLTVKSDPAGIAVTYCGYALLFFSLLFMLVDPKGTFRRLLRDDRLNKGFLVFAALVCCSLLFSTASNAAPTLPKEQAERFGRLNILYNNRICPLQTFAIDFTKKIYGKDTYNGLTAEQVVAGLVFYGNEWNDEPFIRLKKKELRNALNLPKYVSMNRLFEGGRYLLGPYYDEYLRGNDDKLHKQVADIDEKLQLVMDLRRGILLKVFPYNNGKTVVWYSPTEQHLPQDMDSVQAKYINTSFNILYQNVLSERYDNVDNMLLKMRKYQQVNGGASLPTPIQRKAEFAYNAISFAKILFMACLAVGMLSLIVVMVRMTDNRQERKGMGKRALLTMYAIMLLCFGVLTWCLALRWIIGGTVPMSNGYETMLLLAWIIMLVSIAVGRRFPIMLTFGFLLSGFFLLVAYISNMDPKITHIMPVLQSPLLSIHVGVIMMSYALLALTFLCSLTATLLYIAKRDRSREQVMSLALLSRLLLFPSITALGLGIFIGAIWANISWGDYWSWDPKETWALITMLVYAVPLHTETVPSISKPMAYHFYMMFAFLTLLMTYFGVNYLLGGMHSYA